MSDRTRSDPKYPVHRCVGKHYFLGDTCPWCQSPTIDALEYREGDCVACGCLCGVDAYCCDSPRPIQVIRVPRSWMS